MAFRIPTTYTWNGRARQSNQVDSGASWIPTICIWDFLDVHYMYIWNKRARQWSQVDSGAFWIPTIYIWDFLDPHHICLE